MAELTNEEQEALKELQASNKAHAEAKAKDKGSVTKAVDLLLPIEKPEPQPSHVIDFD